MIPDNVLDPPKEEIKNSFRLATIQEITSGGASVKFEGEDTSSGQTYKVVQSYVPAKNDRVVLLNLSGSYIILGSIGAPKTPTEYISLAEKAQPNGVATLNSSGKVVQTALNADHAATSSTATTAGSASSLESVGGISKLSTSSQVTTDQMRNKINEIITAMQNSGMID